MSQSVKQLHQQRQKMWDASIDNHKRYINDQSGLFDEKYVERRNCPSCGKKNEDALFHKEGGSYVHCSNCGTVYLNPVFKDKYLIEYYNLNHDIQSEIVENDSEFYIDLYQKGLDSIAKFTPKNNILDVGCSSGVFLDLAMKNGWNTHGVELNNKEAAYAQKKGHTVYNKLLEEIDFDTKFDAITLWDVFEHIKNGKEYLEMFKKLLQQNGVVFMQIPSADSLAARMLKEECNMFDGLEHVNLYSIKALKHLAKSCGMKVLNIQSVISEIGVMNNYLSYQDPYLGSTKDKTNLLSLTDEKTLLENFLGYKLQIVLGRLS